MKLSPHQRAALEALAAGKQPDVGRVTLISLWMRGYIEDARIGPQRWSITRAGKNALKHGRIMESRRAVGT